MRCSQEMASKVIQGVGGALWSSRPLPVRSEGLVLRAWWQWKGEHDEQFRATHHARSGDTPLRLQSRW